MSTGVKINYKIAATGAMLAAAGIALGAFGAHGLKELISDKYLQVFETGVKYQMYGAMGLIILSFFGSMLKNPSMLILSGLLIFSVSLYFLSMNEVWGDGLKKLGAITPLGGLLMIAGWCWAAVILLKQKNA